MHRTPLAALVLCLAALASGAGAETPFTPYETPQQRIEVAPGRHIHMVCMGQGSPTVILSAGADGWAADWRRVQPEIARTTRVCAWDRAGHGFSSGSPEPQDIRHTEADLERALAGAGVTGPLVLVAHSLGAFESLLFADRHPERVAGLVMVDPSTPDQDDQLAAAAPALMAYDAQSTGPFFDGIRRCAAALRQGGEAVPPDCARLRRNYPEPLRANLLAADDAAYWETFLAMFEARKLDSKLAINPKRDYGATPLVLLEAGRFAFPTAPADAQRDVPAARAVILAGHQAMGRLSTRGTVVSVPDSAHAIAVQKPEVVIVAVNQMVEDVRTRP